MNTALTDEQRLLDETVKQLAGDFRVDPHLATEQLAAPAGWETVAELGLTTMRLPEEAGGSAASVADTVLVAEALAAAPAVLPCVGPVLAAELLLRSEAGAAEIAAALDRGLATLALDPAGDGALPGPGRPAVAFDAAGAEQALGLRLDGAAGTVVRLDLAAARDLPVTDLTRLTRAVDPEAAEAVAVIDGEGVEYWRAFALTLLAADLVGLMSGSLELAIEHARERHQFGKPIGSFQALQHAIADAHVSAEGARSATARAARLLDLSRPADALAAARIAKAYASGAALGVAELSAQVHGAMGNTWESRCHAYQRRAIVDAAALGDERRQLAQIAADRRRGISVGTAEDADSAAFRARLRRWLDANAPAESLPIEDDARAAAQIAWQRKLYEGGWSGLSLPAEYGGGGQSPAFEGILSEELGAAGAPPILDSVYLGHVVLAFADEEQRKRWIPRMISGEDRWCQGFSEPEAGSDLASLRSTAVRSGDGWVVNGQKTWTTSAEWATHCLLLARSDREAPPHRGISAFVVPMDSPGLTSRPIVQSTGHSEFSELFFDDVFVDDEMMLGGPGDGWKLAMTTVTLERGPSDNGYAAKHAALLRGLEEEAQATGAGDSTLIDLARAYVDLEVLRVRVAQSLAQRAAGNEPGPESSVDKLLMIKAEQGLHHLALHLAGAEALAPADADWLDGYMHSRAASIYGGTEQVQRTIIAGRVLGLPRG
ncbi:MAG: acyl-CoA dehydrogenase [Solirubrobacterales bacterium]